LPAVPISDEIYSLPLSVLDLPLHLFRVFQRADISTVGQLLEMELEALKLLKLGEKSIQEVVRRMQVLNLLEVVRLNKRIEPSEAVPTGRHDNRRRPGRGKPRGSTLRQPQPQQEQPISSGSPFGFCYKVPVAQLPPALRMELPRWARCGIEQGEENKTSREELPRRTRFCYVRPFTLGETGKLVEWQPNSGGDVPSHYKVAVTPDEVHRAPFIEVDVREAQALMCELVNAAAPSPVIRVAPSCFLTGDMQAMIAPGVSFPDECTVLEHASDTRASLIRGNQVAIPRRVAQMRIEYLSLSAKTHSCLRQAGIATMGAFLELEEERLGSILDQESLWEIYTAACTKGVLPTPNGILPAEQQGEGIDPTPVFEEFYYYTTGTTSVLRQRGRPDELLYLVHAALFVDRLDGSRNGPVETLWLTSSHIEQSLIWQRELERLERLELRTRVTQYAVSHGAVLPQKRQAEDLTLKHKHLVLEVEEQYNLVPLRSENKQDAPLELFISEADLKATEKEHLSPPSIVIRILEQYLEHPHAQPAVHRLEVNMLDDLLFWLREDRKQLRQLNAAWKRQFPGQPHPAEPSIVMHEEYAIHKYKVWNEATGRNEVREITERVGYRLIIGVLARTRVPSDLIVEPQLTKAAFPAPERPILPSRTPNYVPIQQAA